MRALDIEQIGDLAATQALLDPSDYGPAQSFAKVALAAGAQALLYPSVRDPDSRQNIVVFTPQALSAAAPRRQQSWSIYIGEKEAIIEREFPRRRHTVKLAP